jgi:hypothetical protein
MARHCYRDEGEIFRFAGGAIEKLSSQAAIRFSSAYIHHQ